MFTKWKAEQGQSEEDWVAHTQHLPGDCCGSPSKGLGGPEASLRPMAGPLNVHLKL